jgi:hypothetical protein
VAGQGVDTRAVSKLRSEDVDRIRIVQEWVLWRCVVVTVLNRKGGEFFDSLSDCLLRKALLQGVVVKIIQMLY